MSHFDSLAPILLIPAIQLTLIYLILIAITLFLPPTKCDGTGNATRSLVCFQKLHAWADEYEPIGLITLRWLPANTQPHPAGTRARHRSVFKLQITDSPFFG